jgi:3-deoxy-manno-octulosonate cytidylyltransferase (CMP-KDO synthetase)
MKALGVIPSRYGSTRFPGKPLKMIAGKPLLAWVVEAAQKSKELSDLVVATDHEEIAALARRLGVKVSMTESDLPSGTDRVWQVARHQDAEVVLNIQGDEPLLQAELLDVLVRVFREKPAVEMATLARTFQSREDLESPNTAKVLLNEKGEAIYFSRFPIPYSRLAYGDSAVPKETALKHIGIYGFRKDFLREFCQRPSSAIERAEGLEQLRALSLGAKIQVIQVDYESWGVDTPQDVAKVEARLNGEKNK